ncbi:monooxygenase [Campylobacter sp. RM16192]|uniref:monooxygenase n=1 Tax=Campylobacter sp. RM16192 TaxID=1660080 RepID=UPI0014510DEE|nr:monooxygenase [Campylobacter sp. RM16192]QCD53159.1 putative monooxygenase YdhR [Campylobacter sp. RM16192]
MAVILQVDFPQLNGPFGDQMSEQFKGLAESIAKEPGMIWKIWTENEETKEAGGVYCFDNATNAQKYLKMHTERLEKFGFTNIRGKIFNINLPLSLIDKADFLK